VTSILAVVPCLAQRDLERMAEKVREVRNRVNMTPLDRATLRDMAWQLATLASRVRSWDYFSTPVTYVSVALAHLNVIADEQPSPTQMALHIAELDHALETALNELPRSWSSATTTDGARVAVLMMQCSVRVLPVGERARYRDEFAAELYELREAPRRMQLAFAVRLLIHSMGLRRVLRQAQVAPIRQRGR